MNPDRHATSHYDYFKDLIKGDDASAEAHRRFYDEYNAVLDMDADYYLDTIKTVFQDFKLVNGTWDVRSVDGNAERVTPGDITTTAVMTVEGELDDISGSGQTRAALDMCSGVPETMKKHFEAVGAGHYGIFSGRRWRDMVYPSVKAFILEANQALIHDTRSQEAPKTVAIQATPSSSKTTAHTSTESAGKTASKADNNKPVSKLASKSDGKPTAKPAAKGPTRSGVKSEPKPVTKSVNKAAVKKTSRRK